MGYFNNGIGAARINDSSPSDYTTYSGNKIESLVSGGGNTDYIECTQAEYDAMEQAGTLDPTVMYFITDGQSGGGATELADLADVDITSPTDGQLLRYNGTSGKWENAGKINVVLNSPNLNEPMYFEKQGKVCIISCQTILAPNVTIAAGGTLDLYTIQSANNMPENLKPSTTFISGGLVGMVRMDNTTGKVTLYNQSGSLIGQNAAINFVLAYMTA